MSQPVLRPTELSDLDAISNLTHEVFGRRRSIELLRWLLLSPEPGLELWSRVTELDGEVVGHGAVLRSRYRSRGRESIGAHPILWMARPEGRGRASVMLGGFNTTSGDFTFIIGGTPRTKRVLERRHFERAGSTVEMRLPTRSQDVDAVATDGLELLPYDPTAGVVAAEDGPVTNLASSPHLRWLAACPDLDSRLATLGRPGHALGPVLLYTNRAHDPPTGRIVHLPWQEQDWRPALVLALRELAAAGCEQASLLASGPELLAAAQALGGEPCYERPVWLKDPERRLDPASWYLTYLEADLAYRNV